MKKHCFLSSSTQNHAESFRHYLKKSVLDSKRANLDRNSDFGHFRTYSWLRKLRNTQWKIYGTYLGNIYIYGIYKECIRNIHKYLWYIIIRKTQTQWGGRRRRRLCFWSFSIINIYGYFLYIPYIFHIYIYIRNMFHIFPLCDS